MDPTTLLIGIITVGATVGLALAGGAFRYAVKNEGRMSRVETKVDIIMHHLGLDQEVDRVNGKHKSGYKRRDG